MSDGSSFRDAIDFKGHKTAGGVALEAMVAVVALAGALANCRPHQLSVQEKNRDVKSPIGFSMA